MKCLVEARTFYATACHCWGARVFKALCLLVIAKFKTSRLLVSMRWVCFPGRWTHQALFHLSYLLDILCKKDSLRHCVPRGQQLPRILVFSSLTPPPPTPQAIPFSPSLFLLHQDVAAFSSAAENGTVFSPQFPSKHTWVVERVSARSSFPQRGAVSHLSKGPCETGWPLSCV